MSIGQDHIFALFEFNSEITDSMEIQKLFFLHFKDKFLFK